MDNKQQIPSLNLVRLEKNLQDYDDAPTQETISILRDMAKQTKDDRMNKISDLQDLALDLGFEKINIGFHSVVNTENKTMTELLKEKTNFMDVEFWFRGGILNQDGVIELKFGLFIGDFPTALKSCKNEILTICEENK